MNALTPSQDLRAMTLADVIAKLETLPNLKPTRRRDLVSAVQRTAVMIGYPVEELEADVPKLRAALRVVHPARMDITAKTKANILANLAKALEITRAAPRWHPKMGQSEGWVNFLAKSDAPHRAYALARFARYCTFRGVDPADVSDEVLDAFEAYVDIRLLSNDPKKLRKELTWAWNAIVRTNGLNYTALNVNRAHRYLAEPLSSYPSSLQADICRYLDRLALVDLFEEDGPDKALKPMSLRNTEAHIRQFLDAVLSAGIARETLQSLADVVRIDVVKAGLNAIVQRNGGKLPVGLQNTASTLVAIARHHVRVSDDELRVLSEMKRRTFVEFPGLCPKNTERLQQFDDPAMLRALVLLPGTLVKRAAKRPVCRETALDVMHAVAISILLACPVRVKNLAMIDIEAHLRVVTGKGKARLFAVTFKSEEVKNGMPIDVELGPEASAVLRTYLDTYRRHLSDVPGSALFPKANGGGPRAPSNLSQTLAALIYKETGATVNAHLFRHLAAKIYLERHPGDYETVRRLLGHKKMDTTLQFYASFDMRRAQESYHEAVLDASKEWRRKK